MKRPWLSRKAGKHVVLSLYKSGRRDSVKIEDRVDGEEILSSNPVWPGRNGTACCPDCKKQFKNPSIKDCADELVAVGDLLKRRKAFRCAPKEAVPSDKYLDDRQARLLKLRGLYLPNSRLPRWSGIVNSALYGIETHSEFLNRRQRLVLLELIGILKEEHGRLQDLHSPKVARYVISVLSALIDQLVDWNCRLAMWISQNEQVGRAFCGPGVPMMWDYVETDPLLSGPANLWGKLDRIVAGVSATPHFSKRPSVYQGSAQRLPFGGDTFDAVITDPPYYDNIYYNVLADFFYAWKRPLLQILCPELFSTTQCAEELELVSSHFRQGKNSHEWYCIQLTQCLQEVTRVLKRDGIISFVFAHSSLSAWDAIVRSFRRSGLTLTSAEPLSIERRQRPRAMTSEAVNICIVLVGRKVAAARRSVDIAMVEKTVKASLKTIGKRLKEYGWHEEDIGMAIFAQGVMAIANARNVTGVNSDADALKRLGDIVGSLVPGFKLQVRQSL
jgi:putative DNA methylase